MVAASELGCPFDFDFVAETEPDLRSWQSSEIAAKQMLTAIQAGRGFRGAAEKGAKG